MVDWNAAWRSLEASFNWLVDEATRENATLASSAGRVSTEVFPFTAHLTFSRSGDFAIEDLVVSVDCKLEGDSLVLSSDIANGDGQILVAGPGARVVSTSGSAVAAWIEQVVDFVKVQRGFVCRALRTENGA
jgi:hypothetical protein